MAKLVAEGGLQGRTEATAQRALWRVQDVVWARSPRALACRGVVLGARVLANGGLARVPTVHGHDQQVQEPLQDKVSV
jgi:hypothetical protein